MQILSLANVEVVVGASCSNAFCLMLLLCDLPEWRLLTKNMRNLGSSGQVGANSDSSFTEHS